MALRPAFIAAACATAAIVAHAVRARSTSHEDATHVVAVYAGGGDVPSNLLRIYVEFSASMEPGDAYEHIRLLTSDGAEVKDAFLELREELWTPDRRRLTLLFDPGRLKRGVRSNLEMGPPLTAGHHYRLVIDSAWRDAHGLALATSYEQSLRVVGFDSISPDPVRWSISSPRVDTRDTLRVVFDEPLDHALALRLIAVVGEGGARLPGTVSMSRDDRRWIFLPAAAWPRNARLRVDPALEDLAGNNLARVFDADRRRGGKGAEAAAADTIPRMIALSLRR